VLYFSGARVHVLPGFVDVKFEVPPAGGVLVGTAAVDYPGIFFGAYPVGLPFGCPAVPPYFGAPYNYSVNESLGPGEWFWGPMCHTLGNFTVVHPIEVLYP
jgi:hypothetical protein